MRRIWLALAGILLAGPLAAQDEELLEPEKAFAFSVRTTAADRIEARWAIAPGYYMYRDKIRFELKGGGASLGVVELPPGKEKHDEFFGDIRIFQKEIVASLPIERAAGSANRGPLQVELVARSQGCNEPLGVCYPPLTQTRTLQLAAFEGPAASASPQTAPKIQKLTALKDLLNQPAAGAGPDEFLEPDKAFALTHQVLDGSRVQLRVDIAEGYYLYRDKFKVESRSGSVRVAPLRLPAGKEKHDEFFGDVEVYYSRVEFEVPLLRASIEATDLELAVEYQGCADAGICYPPTKKSLELKLPAVSAISATADAAPATEATKNAAGGNGLKVQADQGLLLAVLGAFGVGLLLTFTPCVLPMIPILSGIVAGQRGEISHLRSGLLATVYVLGTAITYVAVGVFAGYTGEQLQAYVQNIWAIGFFVLVLVALALSMFGFFDIQMPSAIQSRLQERSQGLKGGSFFGVLLMGMVSALIVGACASPLLLSVMGAVIAKQDPVLGGMVMLSLALGMGVVLIAVGFGASWLLPRAGVWMNNVKYAFGVMLLAVAIYLLSLVLPAWELYLWAALLIVTAVYLRALQPLPEGAGGWHYFWKGLGVLMLAWGILALLGAMSDNRDILRPVDVNRMLAAPAGSAAATAADAAPLFTRVASISELDSQLAAAQAAGKPVVIDYYADWCTYCVKMERSTFLDPGVRGQLRQRFVAIKIDVTDPADAQVKALKARYQVFAPPAYLFVSPSGRFLKEHNFYGYQSAEEFAATLERAAAET